MPCAIKNCKVKSNISPRTGLCPSCDMCFSGVSKRMQRHDRQSEARGAQHHAHRHGGGDGDDHDAPPAQQHGFGENQTQSSSQQSLPKIDLAQLISSHNTMDNGAAVDAPKVLKDILGVLINMHAKTDD